MKIEENIYIIIKKYTLGECNRDELRKAILMLRDPELDQKIETILAEIWREDQFSIPKQVNKNLSAILNRIHENIYPELKKIWRRKTKRMFINSTRIAAVLVIGIVLGISINKFVTTKSTIYSTVSPKGSVSQIILPDSTVVYLNSDSELKYLCYESNQRREVFLDGEAWFQVTGNKKKPFVVHTDYYDVKAVGTEFNVKAYRNEKEIVTTLAKGIVIIPSTNKFRMDSDKVLTSGQQLIYNLDKQIVIKRNVETTYYTSWKDNKLIFINMNLEELFILLERKYAVDIEVSDKSILKYHYDGTIKNESILEIMELIKVTQPIEYKVIGQTITITKRNQGGP